MVWSWVMFAGVELLAGGGERVVTESLLVTLTVAPGETLSDIGMNMKFEMVIDVPTAHSTNAAPRRRAAHGRRSTAAAARSKAPAMTPGRPLRTSPLSHLLTLPRRWS